MNLKKRASVLHKLALVVLAAASSDGFAIGLGSIKLQSALNQPLRVALQLIGNDATNIADICAKGKIQSVDGVQLARPQISFAGGAQPSTLVITTTQAINEPAVAINIEVGCGTSVQRDYQILLDPVTTMPAASNSQTASQPTQLAAVSVNPVQSSPSSVSAAPAASSNKSKDARVKRVKAHAAGKKQRASAASSDQSDIRKTEPGVKKNSAVYHSYAKKASHNVLRLSADVSPIDSSSMLNGMKLSDSIHIEGIETDPQKVAELRAAQLRFAAVMRDEDPEKNALNETKAAQDRIQVLTKEADRISKQRDYDRHAFEEEQKKSLNINWFIGLGVVLLACLIAIAWLARRLHQVNKMNQRPFWDHYYSEEGGDTEGNTEQEDSPFSDTVTDFDDTSSLGSEFLPTSADGGAHTENDDTFGKPASDRVHGISKGFSARETPPDMRAETSAEIVPLPKTVATMRNRKRLEMIEVEEISDAMEEAEFWMSLRDPQRAIGVLEQFSDVERPKSPMAWLYLLKLYREVGDKAKFEALLERFKALFNTKAPEWDGKPDEMREKGLEDYPHLVEQICSLWGTDRVARYLEDLLFNNRSGQREGFDLPAYLDLLLLANIAYEVFPLNRNGKPATVSRI